ncbi:MAG: S8 family peptidase [Mycobacterium sp.]
MAIEIPRALIEYILLGRGDSRRQLQDSPILSDVWFKYAEEPSQAADLLITSHKDSTANALAAEIYQGISRPPGEESDPEVAALQTFVAARLYFGEVMKILIPLTDWWQHPRTQDELAAYRTARSRKLEHTVADVIELLDRWSTSAAAETVNKRSAFERFVALCTLVCLAAFGTDRKAVAAESDIAATVLGLLDTMDISHKAMVWQISLNRRATPAIEKSIPTVKADAARRLFGVDCAGINWAIVDSGIDSAHPAFKAQQIKRTYDFTNYRRIVSLGNEKPALRKKNLELIQKAGGTLPNDAEEKLAEIADNAVKGRPVRWDLVKEFVELKDPPTPESEHGTHVAGIIGAAKRDDQESADGMCPGIGLYDFRILSPDISNTEFAVIAALQFIRFTNEQAGFLLIDGVNMSLSIPHDVRNYACGGTPVCAETERLIDNGVVVVAAAGNLGYQHTMVAGQPFDNYAAFSITDPGNAERVITVGSTHRYAPFTYGVSYFSSRGPTGDGRLKPDLVAPGERIHAPLPNSGWGCLDGTSMAAPHVSGAAAMLMARYPELIGRPDKIKRILCETATDLGRKRNFQGHGMIDVLRALQSQ